ncbi:MAG: hypothetical protein JNM84_08680 [Planctomycetes bacterium]|nr:hypothetical protein [Planctomycetota bacterium]
MTDSRRQPNPRYRQPSDLNPRDREHYEVARRFSDWFRGREFRAQYKLLFPKRKSGSILPSDYCFNRDNLGNSDYPRFLLWDGQVRYRFVGLNGHEDAAISSERAIERFAERVPEPVVSDRPARLRRLRSRSRLFQPEHPRPYRLDRSIAFLALREYNADAKVLSQEQHVFQALANGFHPQELLSQLQTLDRAYSTRSVGTDVARISEELQRQWPAWSETMQSCRSLTEAIPDEAALSQLLAPFLASDTRRTPRSLATKALHFAHPQTFAAVDKFSARTMGSALNAGSWSHTAGLDHAGMTRWYRSYLQVLHDIGADNAALIAELLELDAATGPQPYFERVRSLPKLLDKILWWIGREQERN